MTIPTTREAAIAALVAQDVARWGESERAAAERLHAFRTFGLALTELYARAAMAGDAAAPELRRAARNAQTQADRAWLRNGG